MMSWWCQFNVTFPWVGRLLPYNCQIANHSNHTTRPALSFSSIISFSWSRYGNEMDVTIHGDDCSKTFYWPDALLAAKPPMEMTHYQHACGQWGGWGNKDEEVSLCLPGILGDTIITGCNLTSSPGQLLII